VVRTNVVSRKTIADEITGCASVLNNLVDLTNAGRQNVAFLVLNEGNGVVQENRVVSAQGAATPHVHQRWHDHVLKQELVSVLRVEVRIVEVASDTGKDCLDE
jgi:hypothetical protein